MSNIQTQAYSGSIKPLTLEDVLAAKRKLEELEAKYPVDVEFEKKLSAVRQMACPTLVVGMNFPSDAADLVVDRFRRLGVGLTWGRNPFVPADEIWFWDKGARL